MREDGPKPSNGAEQQNTSIEDEGFVTDAWFKAYYKGNSLIPQHMDGIRLSLGIATLLEDTEMDWEKFFNSKLSPQQIEFIGNAMSAMHQRKGIPVSTEGKSGWIKDEEPKIIPEDKLQLIWQIGKERLIESLLGYFNYETDTTPTLNGIHLLRDFFKNPENAPKMENLRIFLGLVKKSFEEPYIKQILTNYREEFRDPLSRPMNVWKSGGYDEEFNKFMFEKALEAFHGKVPPEIQRFLKF